MAKGDTYTIKLTGVEELEQELQRLNSIRFAAVQKKNVKEMFDRAKGTNPAQGGTPVAKNTKWHKGGQMRNTIEYLPETAGIGYTVVYAPHVNFGHRYEKVVDGKKTILWYEGQRFLDRNVEIQAPIYRDDLENAIKKG